MSEYDRLKAQKDAIVAREQDSRKRLEESYLDCKHRLERIAKILEEHDHWLLAADGPVQQEPAYLRRIYLLAIGTGGADV